MMRPIAVARRCDLGYFTNQLVNLVAGGLCFMPPLDATRSSDPLERFWGFSALSEIVAGGIF